MKLKDNTVNLYGLHPMMQIANCKMAILFYQYGVDEMVITSANDSHDKHGEDSLHKKGRACDYRTWFIDPLKLVEFAEKARALLGRDYDVVIEQSHLHIEYDPSDPKII